MKPALAWAVGLAMIVVAWFVSGQTPDGADLASEPFPVSATVGEPAEGRNVGIEVHALALAERVEADIWSAEGTWLVVDLDVWAIESEPGATFNAAALKVGDRTFTASERGESMLGALPLIDMATRGRIAFELPADAADARGTLRLGLNGTSDVDTLFLGDSVIEIPVDLAEVDRVETLTLDETEWVR